MTEKQVRKTVEKYISDKEATLILESQSLLLQIKVLSDPFTSPDHPAQFILHDYLHTQAEVGDYSLIERVNSLVDELADQRARIMMQVNSLRRSRG